MIIVKTLLSFLGVLLSVTVKFRTIRMQRVYSVTTEISKNARQMIDNFCDAHKSSYLNRNSLGTNPNNSIGIYLNNSIENLMHNSERIVFENNDLNWLFEKRIIINAMENLTKIKCMIDEFKNKIAESIEIPIPVNMKLAKLISKIPK
jgi:hypothetical protein